MKNRTLSAIVAYLVVVTLLLGMVPAAPVAAAPPAGPDRIEKGLQNKMKANSQGQFRVIVSMKPGKAKEARGAIEKVGRKIGRSLPIIGGASAILPAGAIEALAKNPNVYRIYEDSTLQLLGLPVSTVSTLAVQAPEAWALGYTGRGIGVAILDSGVAPHADLTSPTNRIVASVDTAGNAIAASDGGGHGTHVAGIVAGNGSASQGARQGVAPEANIISVKVTDDTGIATYSSVIYGIQWVVRNKSAYNIRVMNLSLGAPVARSYKDDPLIGALEIAWFSGIVVTVAAGNTGSGSGTITSPGNDPYVITVGAMDDMATASVLDDTLAWFSSRGPTAIDNLNKPDLVAPGRKVVSLRSVGSFLEMLYPDRIVENNYFRLTGTSMSAPVVAGIAALSLQKDPTLRPNQVKYILSQSATSLPLDRNAVGAGMVSALGAVTYPLRDIDNRGKRPSDTFARTIYPLAQGAPMNWRNSTYMGRNWSSFDWETLPWDTYTWDNFDWESIDWESASWSSYDWESFTWENFEWESFEWDTFDWETNAQSSANSTPTSNTTLISSTSTKSTLTSVSGDSTLFGTVSSDSSSTSSTSVAALD